MNNYILGNKGESLTKDHYIKNGYKLVSSNFDYYKKKGKGRQGEIDLIFTKNNILVIVEVKSRNNLKFGHALEQIDHRKLNYIQKSYSYFLLKNPKYSKHFARFDAATLQNGELQIIKNAYSF
ncbi:YraN family protein [Candidatus Gracilibacteria bacterium]|nr:YraN family protein [Candidatus Gracilibacteria bacterium]